MNNLSETLRRGANQDIFRLSPLPGSQERKKLTAFVAAANEKAKQRQEYLNSLPIELTPDEALVAQAAREVSARVEQLLTDGYTPEQVFDFHDQFTDTISRLYETIPSQTQMLLILKHGNGHKDLLQTSEMQKEYLEKRLTHSNGTLASLAKTPYQLESILRCFDWKYEYFFILHPHLLTQTQYLQELVPLTLARRGVLDAIATNLLENTIKAIQGLRHVWVDYALNIKRQEMTLSVIDNGIGIPASLLKSGKIFDGYSGFAAQGIAGTGIGLPFVKTEIEKLGGRLAVTSREHVGMRVSIILPVEA